MRQRDIRLLVLIVLVTTFAAWVAWPANPGIHFRLGENRTDRDIDVQLGLDLRGGMQVLLEADLPEDQGLDADSMTAARSIVENRVNALGVTEPIVQAVGTRRILVELPGIRDPEAAVATLKGTGLMEWIDSGSTFLQPGTIVETDFGRLAEASEEMTPTTPIYRTVLTGRNLKTARVEFDQSGFPVIAFELDSEGAKIFAEHTANNVNRFMCIVLDKQVISSPRIQSAIPEGRGQITGQFTSDEAKAMVLQLRYGALPVPLNSSCGAYPRRRVCGQECASGYHRSCRRAAVHADLLPLARPAGRRSAHHLCASDPGHLQTCAGDSHLAGHRRVPALCGHGSGCEHLDF